MQLLFALFIAASLCLFSGLDNSARAASGAIRVRLTSSPNTLDWNIATMGSESAILQNIMEGLFSQDVTGFPQNDLAKSFTWSKDLKTLSIEIKNDVKWSDGKTLEAQDFIFSFSRLLDPKLNSQNASLLFDVDGARDYFLGKTSEFSTVGIRALNRTTLEFRLKEPRANFLEILTHWSTFPMRKDHPSLTLGPYRLQARTPSAIRLIATRKNIEIQQATFEIISDGSEALQAYRKNKVDYLLQLDDSLINSEQLTELPKPGLVDAVRVVALLHVNPTRLATNTPEKRRTIMTEVPVQSVLDESPKTRSAASSIIPAGTLGGPAVTLDKVFEPHGERADPEATVLTLAYPDDALSRTIAETIQKHSTNLKIKIEPLPKGELSSASKRYDLVLTIFGLDYPDPDQLLSSFLSQGTHDLFNVSSGDLMKLIQTARLTADLDMRGKLYAQAADLLQSKLAIVMPLFYRRRSFLMRPTFTFDQRRQGTANLTQIHLNPHPEKR